ncbi:MAG: bacillithiol biosynthesis cysteine-adding enzyme BshC [Ignavibacteria bacterium]
MFINFCDLPGQQNLFLDYLYEFENVRDFYHKDFRDENAYLSLFEELSKRDRKHNQMLISTLKEQYSGLNTSKQTLHNIESLNNKKTFAIVTGQQLGLYTGPLYTIYKTITAIKLAARLKSKYKKYDFVPVFWLEGDDHDFDEVCSINLANDNNDIITISYDDQAEEGINRGSVGNLKFNETINLTNDELDKVLRANDFKAELMDLLKKAYQPGVTFKKAFRDILFDLFDHSGLIIFDPQSRDIKELLKPVFRKEIEEFNKHTKELVKVSAGLEEIYHAQVKINPVNIFLLEPDGRFLIEPVEDEFRLKTKRKRITKELLLETLENEPQRFSPNVLLRPICQDYLLPTAAYIAGPGEISYFAQVMPLYDFFDVPQPIIYPRSSVTLIEKPVKKIMEKFNLKYIDLFTDKNELNNIIIGRHADFNVKDIFNMAETDIADIIMALNDKLITIDPTLNEITLRTKERIDNSLKILRDKTNEAQKKRYETTLRQINKASTLIAPLSDLQERELSFIYFAHKYGLNFLDDITAEIEIYRFEHQIIEL